MERLDLGVKIAVVGAGSTYTPELVDGLATRADRLPVDELALLDIDGARVLLPGDAEADTLERYRLPALDVLVVGHHGSRDAVSGSLLDALHPGLAVISVGKDNTFGHPDPSTIALLRAAGQTIVRTDESGWVSLRRTNGAMAVVTERTRAP